MRIDATFDIVFGGGKHAITITPMAFNHYFGVSDAVSSGFPEDYGFDSGGNTWAITIGYTLRFHRDLFAPDYNLLE